MSASIIADGYTLRGSIPGLKNVYPALGFRYRPALPRAAYAYYNAGREEKHDAAIKLLVGHLVDWDAKDKYGNRIQLVPETLATLHYPVLERLIEHVLSFLPALEEDEGNLPSGPG
jgi:hypothetical protein